MTPCTRFVKASVAEALRHPSASSPIRRRTITPPEQQSPPPVKRIHMRFPSFPTFLRAFHTVTNTTSAFIRSSPTSTLGRTIYNTPQRAVIYRSMPNIPFLGALFGSSSSMADNTNYPVQKPEGEWQAQLSPGTIPPVPNISAQSLTPRQSSSASSERRVPKCPAPANSTSTTPTPASTSAPVAKRPSTRQTTSSTLAVGGPRSGMPFLARWDRSLTMVLA